jgi:hypothetical protein
MAGKRLGKPMMRIAFLFAALGVAACSSSPASLGITGPGAQPVAPPAPSDDIAPAGVPDVGNTYSPSYGPIPSGNGRYFNYN